jgi:hypothetical protein
VIGSAAHLPIDGVGERAQPGRERADDRVDLAEEFLVSPFGFFFPVDFAVVTFDDVVPDGVKELPFFAGVVAAESISHNLRVAALPPPPRL